MLEESETINSFKKISKQMEEISQQNKGSVFKFPKLEVIEETTKAQINGSA